MREPDEPAPGDDPVRRPTTSPTPATVMTMTEPRAVWRGGLVVLLLVAIASFVKFVLEDGGSVIFTLLMAWFASIAMEPAVARLSTRMRRGAATGLVMAGVALFCLLFALLFGRLLTDQLIQAVQSIPTIVGSVLDWVNDHFGTSYTQQEALDAIGLTQDTLSGWAKDLASGLLGFIVSALGAFFGLFTFLLFTFYFSADAIRLRRWTARLFAPKYQNIVLTVWDLATQKTGGYVAARVVLATINGATTALFLLVIGMPYWLALGIWTGLVSQFVPTVGTYIAIILPTVVGLTGPNPVQGVLALAWGIAYQQVENLTLEPQISAKAVDVHPAVSFASVMLGAALFGPAGAILGIPVAAMLLALLDIYARKYELLPQLVPPSGADTPVVPHDDSMVRRGQRWFKNMVSRRKESPEVGGEVPSTARAD